MLITSISMHEEVEQHLLKLHGIAAGRSPANPMSTLICRRDHAGRF